MNSIIFHFLGNGRIWTIDSIDLIEHLSVLVLDMVFNEDICQH